MRIRFIINPIAGTGKQTGIEDIIAKHGPLLDSAKFYAYLEGHWRGTPAPTGSFFELYKKSNDGKIQSIVNSYFSKISFINTNKSNILDKNPLNFQWLGFIKILFPNSKIIHCTRNLKDTALSIYKNAFDINSIVWSNNQDDLVKYISIYLDLMRFWEKKLSNFIYKLNYEKLVENKEEEIQKILNFCELEWEEDCLNFNEKASPIKTVSVTQARKPIYKTSLNSYEKYFIYLDMFKKIEEIEKKIQ